MSPKKAAIRKCRVCGRWLSDGNRHPDLCFHHQTDPRTEGGRKMLEARDYHETAVRTRNVCSSRVNPISSVAFDYDGDGRNA